ARRRHHGGSHPRHRASARRWPPDRRRRTGPRPAGRTGMNTLIEICVDSVAGARIAENAGADRVELCAGLAEGGTTPSIGTIQGALRAVNRIGVQILIRPRGGDFIYDADEVDVMLADIAAIRATTPRGGTRVGFVLGALTPAGDID